MAGKRQREGEGEGDEHARETQKIFGSTSSFDNQLATFEDITAI